MKLTKAKIDSFRYAGHGNSRDVRWDNALPGFGVRIYPSGRKAFVLSYRANGRKRLLTLGTYGAPLTLDKAREATLRELSKVLDGQDPVEHRRQSGQVETFADLAQLYLVRHARPNKRMASAKEDERIIKRELLPRWGSRKAVDIRRRDVIELLDTIKDRGAPIMANRTLALTRKVFNFAIGRDIAEVNPCAQVAMPSRERPRQRVLDDDELRTLWPVFEGLGPIVGAMFKFRALTLQRGGEIATMRWSDIDADTGWWTIPPEFTKNGLAHRVPLSPQVLKLLDDLGQYRHASDWVFPSPSKPGKHVANIGKAVGRTKAVSGVDFVPHDLRRTGASRLTGLGIPRLVVSKLLNHVETGITAVYDRHSYDAEKRHALDLWGQYVEKLVSGQEPPTNVVELTQPA